MVPKLWLIASLFTSQPGATESVQRSMSSNNNLFRRCFEENKAEAGFAQLRFRVGTEQKAEAAALSTLEPESDALSSCLLRALSMVTFDREAVGADVVYPVRYASEAPEPSAQGPREGAPARLSITRRDGVFLIDDWMVVDPHGLGVSDLELTRLAGATELHDRLDSKRGSLYTYALVEGLVSMAAVVTGGIGLIRVLDDPDRGSRGVDTGLAIGGAGVSLTAGGLCIYHLIRALDLGARAPTWHHLELDEARELAERANGS